MAIFSNHYEAAFEAYLRDRKVPYVAVDESRRALLKNASLKSMDFIVYGGAEGNLLVDVKGRRFPSGTNGRRWTNWAGDDDIDSLRQWQQIFGPGFRSVLLFAYHLHGSYDPGEFEEIFRFRDETYAFFGVYVDDFADEMYRHSPSWETMTLSATVYRRLRWPFAQVLTEADNPGRPNTTAAQVSA